MGVSWLSERCFFQANLALIGRCVEFFISIWSLGLCFFFGQLVAAFPKPFFQVFLPAIFFRRCSLGCHSSYFILPLCFRVDISAAVQDSCLGTGKLFVGRFFSPFFLSVLCSLGPFFDSPLPFFSAGAGANFFFMRSPVPSPFKGEVPWSRLDFRIGGVGDVASTASRLDIYRYPKLPPPPNRWPPWFCFC